MTCWLRFSEHVGLPSDGLRSCHLGQLINEQDGYRRRRAIGNEGSFDKCQTGATSCPLKLTI